MSRKILLWTLVILLVLVVVTPLAGWLYLRTSLPQTSGTLRTPGLDAPLEIVRDADGVPHIFAATDRDAFPATGRARSQFERSLGGTKRARAAALVHLIVRERIVSALILVRWRDLPFDAEDVRYFRSIAPLLSIADALHQHLDQAERATVPRVLRCHDQRLTPHQRELVEHVALGHTNAAIASTLGRSVNTVRNTLAEVMRRLDASNRAEVVRLAVLR